jgi:glucose-1-phosphate adenylyltransferase
VHPQLNLYNRNWPLRTAGYEDPPAKFTFDEHLVRGSAVDSIVSGGSIISGGAVRNCIIGRGVRVYGGAEIDDSVIFDNCEIGRGAKVRRAILDKNVRVPDGAKIGYDLEADRKLYSVTESGIVTVEGRRSRVDVSSLDIGRRY